MNLTRYWFVVAGAMICAYGFARETDLPWRQYTIDSSLDGADGVRLGDADGDGDLDIAAAWEQSGRSRLYLNPGTLGAAEHSWPYIDFGKTPGVEDALPADVDGDGRMDVISAGAGTVGLISQNARMSIHFAPPEGDYRNGQAWTTASFPASIAGNSRWMFSVMADVNRDGHRDIVSGSRYLAGGAPALIGWFETPAENKRDLTRWRFHKMGDAGWVMSLIARDMDGDGDMDFVVSDRKTGSRSDLRGVRWLENPDDPAKQQLPWNNHWIGARGREVMFIAMADMNGDGDPDVVVPSIGPNRITWYERLEPSGDAWREHEIDYPQGLGSPKAIAISDINCDGKPDLVITCEAADAPKAGVAWLEHPGAGPTGHHWVMHPVSGPIVTSRQPWLQQVLGWPETFGAAGIKFDRVEVTDLDGDGDPDVITTEENQGKKSRGLGVVWYQNPHNNCVAP